MLGHSTERGRLRPPGGAYRVMQGKGMGLHSFLHFLTQEFLSEAGFMDQVAMIRSLFASCGIITAVRDVQATPPICIAYYTVYSVIQAFRPRVSFYLCCTSLRSANWNFILAVIF